MVCETLLSDLWFFGAVNGTLEYCPYVAQPSPHGLQPGQVIKRRAISHISKEGLLCYRAVFLDGLDRNIWTGHSILLCFMFGPLGLLSHLLTREVVYRAKRKQVYARQR